jgi:hypothetical protein
MTNTEWQIAEIAIKPHKGVNEIEIAKSITEDAKLAAIFVTADQVMEMTNHLRERNILTLAATPTRNIAAGELEPYTTYARFIKGPDWPPDYGM